MPARALHARLACRLSMPDECTYTNLRPGFALHYVCIFLPQTPLAREYLTARQLGQACSQQGPPRELSLSMLKACPCHKHDAFT